MSKLSIRPSHAHGAPRSSSPSRSSPTCHCSAFSSTSTSASRTTTRWSPAIGLPELRLDTALRVTLPLGISFYTFESMSYAIDVYRGQATRHPQLHRLRVLRVDVPAARGRPDHPLLGDRRSAALAHAHDHEVRARRRVLRLGLAKKVLLANPCGKIADLAFDAGSSDHARRLVRRARPTRSRSTSTSAATRTWPSASG